MDHVVGQVLVQVGEGVGVLGQGLVLAPQPGPGQREDKGKRKIYEQDSIRLLGRPRVPNHPPVPGGDLAELDEVYHVDGGDVVLPPRQVVPPVALLPEPESLGTAVICCNCFSSTFLLHHPSAPSPTILRQDRSFRKEVPLVQKS